MSEIIPEALPVRVDVSPAVVVRVEGPGGLSVTLTCPDNDEAYDALEVFVGALPQAIEQGMRAAETEAEGA